MLGEIIQFIFGELISMLNIQLRFKTNSGIPVRNVKEEKRNCNCNLSSSFNFSGEIFVGGIWHRTKWNSNGVNASGIHDWNIQNY